MPLGGGPLDGGPEGIRLQNIEVVFWIVVSTALTLNNKYEYRATTFLGCTRSLKDSALLRTYLSGADHGAFLARCYEEEIISLN